MTTYIYNIRYVLEAAAAADAILDTHLKRKRMEYNRLLKLFVSRIHTISSSNTCEGRSCICVAKNMLRSRDRLFYLFISIKNHNSFALAPYCVRSIISSTGNRDWTTANKQTNNYIMRKYGNGSRLDSDNKYLDLSVPLFFVVRWERMRAFSSVRFGSVLVSISPNCVRNVSRPDIL